MAQSEQVNGPHEATNDLGRYYNGENERSGAWTMFGPSNGWNDTKVASKLNSGDTRERKLRDYATVLADMHYAIV